MLAVETLQQQQQHPQQQQLVKCEPETWQRTHLTPAPVPFPRALNRNIGEENMAAAAVAA